MADNLVHSGAYSFVCQVGTIEEITNIRIGGGYSDETFTIVYHFGSLIEAIETRTSNRELQWQIPAKFYAQIPNAKMGIGYLECHRYRNDALYRTDTCDLTVYCNEERNKPVMTIDAKDTGKTLPTGYKTTDLTGSNKKIIKGVSDVNVTVTATAKNYSSLVSYNTYNGEEFARNRLGAIFYETVSNKFSATSTDSRGFSTSVSESLEMAEYENIKTTEIIFKRISQTSSNVKFSVKGTYFNGNFGAINNTITLKYRYKEAGTNTWSEYASLTLVKNNNSFSYSNNALLTDLNYQKAYNFEFVLTDKINIYTIPLTITKGIPVMDMGESDVNINGTLTKNKEEILSETVLYSNASGTTGTVTLSESAANFKELLITYHRQGVYYITRVIRNPNGKTVALTGKYGDANLMQINSKLITINGKTITVNVEIFANIYSNNTISAFGTQNGIYISEVVGRR